MSLSGTVGSLSLAEPVDLALTLSDPFNCDSAGIRFADVNGDSRADFICVGRSGDVTIGMNTGKGGFTAPEPKFSVYEEISTSGTRDAISFADINGDGYADYLFFDTITGTVTTRLNTGKGDSFENPEVIYSDPTFVGGYVRFARLNGRRADMININPLSAKARVSSNRCPPPTPPTGIGPNPNPPSGEGPTNTDPEGDGTGVNLDGSDADDNSGNENNDGDGNDDDDDDDDDGDDSDYDYAPETDSPCDYSNQYASLDELNDAAPNIRGECLPVPTMQVLGDMLDSSYSKFSNVNNGEFRHLRGAPRCAELICLVSPKKLPTFADDISGYDELFGYYVTYINKLVQPTLDKFLFKGDPGDGSVGSPATGLQFFDCIGGRDGNDKFPCTDIANPNRQEEIRNYPTSFHLRDQNGYAAALANAGLNVDWVSFEDYRLERDTTSLPAAGGPPGVSTGTEKIYQYFYNFRGFPRKNSSMVCYI
jgi:hypothetical protein